jgi:DNA primase
MKGHGTQFGQEGSGHRSAVEGMFDLAVLWQAGFHNVTCALGSQLNALQLLQIVAAEGIRKAVARCT